MKPMKTVEKPRKCSAAVLRLRSFVELLGLRIILEFNDGKVSDFILAAQLRMRIP